jgi:hypothetical protein
MPEGSEVLQSGGRKSDENAVARNEQLPDCGCCYGLVEGTAVLENGAFTALLRGQQYLKRPRLRKVV